MQKVKTLAIKGPFVVESFVIIGSFYCDCNPCTYHVMFYKCAFKYINKIEVGF